VTTKVQLLPLCAVGESAGLGSGPGGDLIVFMPRYPVSRRGERLREAYGENIRRLGPLGAVSRSLGLTPAQFCGLWRGKYQLSEADWAIVDSTLGIDTKETRCATTSSSSRKS
jgi:hypothetical protein